MVQRNEAISQMVTPLALSAKRLGKSQTHANPWISSRSRRTYAASRRSLRCFSCSPLFPGRTKKHVLSEAGGEKLDTLAGDEGLRRSATQPRRRQVAWKSWRVHAPEHFGASRNRAFSGANCHEIGRFWAELRYNHSLGRPGPSYRLASPFSLPYFLSRKIVIAGIAETWPTLNPVKPRF
jgi:hypothetical protein